MKMHLKNTLRVGCILFLSLFQMMNLSAQNRIELSLDGAIQFAMEHNKMIQNASLSIQESQAAHRAAIAQGLPQVEAKIDYQNYFNSTASIGPMSFTFNPTSNLNISVGQLIFSGNYIVGIQMASLYKEITEISSLKTDADIRAQVMNSYFLVLISKRSLEILGDNLKNMEDVIVKTTALVTVGILDETDGDQIRLQKIMLENAILSAERQLELATNLLRIQLGVNAQTEIFLTDDIFSILSRSNIGLSLDSKYDVNQNLDFRLMLLQKDMAKKKLYMEKVKFLPTIAGFYSYTEKLKKPELDFSPKNIIGFNINVPLFSSGARYFTHTQAKLQYQSVMNQVDLVSDQLSVQEKQLRQNLKTAREQYESQRENIELARKVYNNMYIKYQQGIVSGLDMTTANTNLLQAENGYIMAIMQLFDAKVTLDKFLNQLNK